MLMPPQAFEDYGLLRGWSSVIGAIFVVVRVGFVGFRKEGAMVRPSLALAEGRVIILALMAQWLLEPPAVAAGFPPPQTART
jgi:hypothetical protein